MKRMLLTLFACFGMLAQAEPDTTDIRKYHQQLEERVFELEEGENQEQKIAEAFLHGKRRIADAKKNEKVILEAEGKETSDKLVELEILEKKYNKVMTEYEKLSLEKKRIVEENKIYLEELKKLERTNGERR